MTEHRRSRFLSLACWMTLTALAMYVWSVLDPRPIPVMVAMSVGQGLGTLATLAFAWVVLTDLLRARVFSKEEK